MRIPLVLRAPILSVSGYGYHARRIFETLFDSDDWDVFLLPVLWGSTSTSSNFPKELLDKIDYATQSNLPPDTSKVLWMQLGIPTEFQRKGKVNIGFTAGIEADKASEPFVQGCNRMDGVFVPSKFIHDVFLRSGVTRPIDVIHEPFDDRTFDGAEPLEFSVPSKFNFLCVGQWLAGGYGNDRKNISLLITEFVELFKGREDVGLLLKTFCNNMSSADRYVTRERLAAHKGGHQHPFVYLIHGDMSNEEMWGLYKSPQVNAFVLPTHGEGYGLPILDAIVSGVPTITTGWGGHLDFTPREQHTLLDFQLDKIPDASLMPPIFVPGQRWAYPEIEQLRRHMKLVVERYDSYKKKATDPDMLHRIKTEFGTESFKSKLLDALDRYRTAVSGSKIITFQQQPGRVQL